MVEVHFGRLYLLPLFALDSSVHRRRAKGDMGAVNGVNTVSIREFSVLTQSLGIMDKDLASVEYHPCLTYMYM